MSLRTRLLSVKDRIRARVLSPTGFDLTPHQLTIRTVVWSGGRRGAGTSNPTDFTLPQRYRVRAVSVAEISGSGGRYRAGDMKVEHITPFDGVSVGYTPAQLDPASLVTAGGTEVIYVLAGPMAGDYSLVNLDFTHDLSYTLVIRNRRTTP